MAKTGPPRAPKHLVVNQGRTMGCCTCRMTEEGSGKLLSLGTTVFVIRPRQSA
jgi:hypothetical protein